MNCGWNSETFLLPKYDARKLALKKGVQLNRLINDVGQKSGQVIHFRWILFKIPIRIFKRDQIENRSVAIRERLTTNDIHPEIRKDTRNLRE